MGMFENREFTIDQRLLSVRNTYVVKNKLGEQLGFIKQEFVSWGPRFWFEDNAEVHIGEVDGKVLTTHHEFEVKDEDGQTMARIKKKIIKLFGSEWWMEDAAGNEIARVKGNVVHHTYEIVAPDKTVIAKVHLNWATVRDEYCVEMVKEGFPSMLVLGVAVAVDHVEHPDRSTVTSGLKVAGKLFGR